MADAFDMNINLRLGYEIVSTVGVGCAGTAVNKYRVRFIDMKDI